MQIKYITSILLAGFLLFGPEVSRAQSPQVRHTSIGHGKKKYLFSFAVMSDIHMGENAPEHDYGSPGFFDGLIATDSGYPAERLASAVRWINANYKKKDIRFVMVSGDLTESAEKSEFLKVRQLMDSLQVPYVPGIGNHDVWPYNCAEISEADHACGDSLLNEVFAAEFDSLKHKFDFDEGTRQNRWLDPDSKSSVYMQNYSFSLMGQRFVFLDFNSRVHCGNSSPGIGSTAELTDYPGGTLNYLRTTLRKAADKNEGVFLISHHPPMRLPLKLDARYAFSREKKAILGKTFQPYKYTIRAWFAGHLHRWATYKQYQVNGLRIYETRSNKGPKYGAIRLVKVYAQ